MSRRARNDEIELGSDSFLDIIANIVGILIILIVIAGVKVSRQPITPQSPPDTVTQVAVEPVRLVPETEPAPESVEVEPIFPLPPAPSRFVEATQDPKKPRAVFDGSFKKQEASLRRFAERQRMLSAELVRLATVRRQSSATVDKKIDSNTMAQAELASLRKRIGDKRSAASLLRRQLAQAEQQQVDVHQIEHKVTPVGRDVSGSEVHFRVARGKVSYVPVDELVAELKGDASRKQSQLMTSASYRGVVGPIKGYRMSYEIVRKHRSIGDELRFGAGLFRVVVNEWEVEPTPSLEEETLQQALRAGSLFDRRLMTLERDANVTFWVYPDAFDEFRALQAQVHREGLTVAGRPLPFGVPIAGSPNGTKSSGQ